MQKLKKIFSLFTLLVFLSPFVERELHSYSHASDTHCTSAEKHYHAPEHHCDLCDFTNDLNGIPSFYHPDLILNAPVAASFFFSAGNLTLKEKEFCSLRAPPALV